MCSFQSLGVVLYVLVCGALPFDGPNLQVLRDRVLSGRFRIPYFMSSECEHLIRRMLVLDPLKRYSIANIRAHRWMQLDGGYPHSAPPSPIIGYNAKVGEFNEQILRIMQSLGIDPKKTMEALRKDSYDHYTAIYYLLLDRLRHHRSSFPTDTRVDARRRRPSTIAEQAMLQNTPGRPLIGITKHGGFSRTLDAPGAGAVHLHRNYPLTEVDVVPPPPSIPHCMAEVIPMPFSKSSQATSGTAGSVITTSIDEGVEVDIIDRRDSDVESVSEIGMGYTSRVMGSFSGFGGSRSEMPYNSVRRKQSCGSMVSGTLSPCTSIDSSLGIEFSLSCFPSVHQQPTVTCSSSSPPNQEAASTSVAGLEATLSNFTCGGGESTGTQAETSQHPVNVYPGATLNHLTNVNSGVSSRHGRYSISGPTATLPVSLPPEVSQGNQQFLQVTQDQTIVSDELYQDRGQTRSPVNFREGRRASDGLVAQGIIAFKQKLKESMRAQGMIELRQEHQQLQNMYNAQATDNSTTIPTSVPVIAATTATITTTSSLQPTKPLQPHRKLSAPHYGFRQWSLDEPSSQRRRPLMKRMSLPSESFDMQPHRLLAMKQAIQVEEHLERANSKDNMEGQQSLNNQQITASLTSMGENLSYSYCTSSPSHSSNQQRLQQKRQTFQKHGQLTQQFQELNLLPGSGTGFGSSSVSQVGVGYFSQAISQCHHRNVENQGQAVAACTNPELEQNTTPSGICQTSQCGQLTLASSAAQSRLMLTESGQQTALYVSQPSQILAEGNACQQQSCSNYKQCSLSHSASSLANQPVSITPCQSIASSLFRQSDSFMLHQKQFPNKVQQNESLAGDMFREAFPNLIQQRMAMSSFTHQPIGEQLQLLAISSQSGSLAGNTPHPQNSGDATVYISQSQNEPFSASSLESGNDTFSDISAQNRTNPLVDIVDDSCNNSLSANNLLLYNKSDQLYSTDRQNVCNITSQNQQPGIPSPSLSSLVWLTQPVFPTPSFSYLGPTIAMNFYLDNMTPEQSIDTCIQSDPNNMSPAQTHSTSDQLYSAYQLSQAQSYDLQAHHTKQSTHKFMGLSSPSTIIESPEQNAIGLSGNNSEVDFMTVDPTSSDLLEESVPLSKISSSHLEKSHKQPKAARKGSSHGNWVRRQGVFMAVHPFQNQFPYPSGSPPTSSPPPGLCASASSSSSNLSLSLTPDNTHLDYTHQPQLLTMCPSSSENSSISSVLTSSLLNPNTIPEHHSTEQETTQQASFVHPFPTCKHQRGLLESQGTSFLNPFSTSKHHKMDQESQQLTYEASRLNQNLQAANETENPVLPNTSNVKTNHFNQIGLDVIQQSEQSEEQMDIS